MRVGRALLITALVITSPSRRTHSTEGQRHLHLRTTARRRNRL